MLYIPTDISGLTIIEPQVHSDARGYFLESFSQRDFEQHLGPVQFVQDNESQSTYGVVRGMHFQCPPYAQAKLVRCVEGAVLDVAVDLRRSSRTYGRHLAVELSAANHRMLYIPRGFAHGFAVLSQRAVFQYKCDNYYAPQSEGGINVLDPALAIAWPVAAADMILSPKDLAAGAFDHFISPFS